jgi:CHASE2 domain-containing sensor protein
MKQFLRIDNLIITVIIFVFMWLFTLIPFKLIFLDPITKSLADFEMYDVVFSKIREEQQVDTNIVLINIRQLDRKGIAQQIALVNNYQPKVIGVDALFLERRDTLSDNLLALSFSFCSNLVLASKLNNFIEDLKCYDSLVLPHPLFMNYANTGFANLPTNNVNSKTIRMFKPTAILKNGLASSFSAEVVKAFDKSAYLELFKRGNAAETINYRGNFNKFYLLDYADLNSSAVDLSFIKDKIVIMGYIGPSVAQKDLEDIYFTPLNENYAGRSYPDMYGVVIHANIISMILNRNYINVMPKWLSFLLAFLMCYVNVYLVRLIYENITDYYGGLVKLLISFQMILSLIVTVQIFHMLNYKISLTIALIAIVLTPSSVVFYEKLFKNYAKSYKKKIKAKKIK